MYNKLPAYDVKFSTLFTRSYISYDWRAGFYRCLQCNLDGFSSDPLIFRVIRVMTWETKEDACCMRRYIEPRKECYKAGSATKPGLSRLPCSNRQGQHQERDCRAIGGQAAIATSEAGSTAWNS